MGIHIGESVREKEKFHAPRSAWNSLRPLGSSLYKQRDSQWSENIAEKRKLHEIDLLTIKCLLLT